MCKREYLHYLRVREWQEFQSQLRQVAKEMKLRIEAPGGEPDADGIHQALLSGLLSHIGLLEEREKPTTGRRSTANRRPGPREYLGARGAKFAIFPGSGLARKNPPFVMAFELVETGRLWARQNAAIEPEWAERLGGHLVKRTYSEPHWSQKRQSVMARERVTLYGVPLVTDRLISFGKVDRELAREIFIRHALVYGEWSTRHQFFHDNRKLLEQAEELEHRARRRDLVVDEHTLFDFYDARVGPDVVSGAHFDQWWKGVRREHPDLLTFDPAMLTHDAAAEVSEQDYPEQWVADGGLTFDLGLPLRAGCRRRRHHHRRAGRGAQPGRRRGLLVERPRPARGARDRAAPQPARSSSGSTSCRRPTRLASSSPPCRPGRSRCSTRSSATCARPRACTCRASRGDSTRWRRTCARPTGSSTTRVASRRAART